MSANHFNNTVRIFSSKLFALLALTLAGQFITAGVTLAQDEDPLFRAMQDELSRSIERLQLEGQEKPYFIEYRVSEEQSHNIAGSFGALIRSRPSFSRDLAVDVRAGNYSFDNTGFLARADLFDRLGPGSTTELAIEDNYMALRRDLWLATDKAYKSAVEQMAAKRGFLKSRVDKDSLPDFSREAPTTMLTPHIPFSFNTSLWEEKVRGWSAVAKDYPEVQKSIVALNARTTHFYLVNNEGTRVRTARTIYAVTVDLSAQAEDGLPLSRSITMRSVSEDGIPSNEIVIEAIRSLASEIKALQTSGTLEETYIGPVLLVDQAACALFQQTLVPHLSGSRLPLLEDESLSAFVGGESELATRIKRRIMPRYVAVYDDPNQENALNTPLMGHYSVDHQGIAARKISIVENGVLKGLPTSRRPSKKFPNSNGHGRGFSEPGTVISNLFIETKQAKSHEELKAELIQACIEQELEYGIMVRHMNSSGRSSMSGGGVSVSFGVSGPSASSVAYKIFQDGREELLRGVSVEKLNLRTLKDILATGSDYSVLNTSAKPRGTVSFATVPVSIIAPSVLLEEAEVTPSEQAKEKPALLTNPFFGVK